jgi:hypothetical protein
MPTELLNNQLLENQYLEKRNKTFGPDCYIKLIGKFAKMNCGPDRFIPEKGQMIKYYKNDNYDRVEAMNFTLLATEKF